MKYSESTPSFGGLLSPHVFAMGLEQLEVSDNPVFIAHLQIIVWSEWLWNYRICKNYFVFSRKSTTNICVCGHPLCEHMVAGRATKTSCKPMGNHNLDLIYDHSIGTHWLVRTLIVLHDSGSINLVKIPLPPTCSHLLLPWCGSRLWTEQTLIILQRMGGV